TKPFDIHLNVVQRCPMSDVESLQTLHGLFNVADAHRDVEPVENVPHGPTRRDANERAQCRITITDDRYRLIFLPALIGHGDADQLRGLLCCTAHQRESTSRASPDLDFASDRLEMPDLIPRH